jgi:ABC-2 type transport system ATP-binding protein
MYMGIHPREMRKRSDKIAEFTELGDYLSMPLRTYSSGMTVRLSFAIATWIGPEILLLDEGLSAGDAPFIAKAKKRMDEFVRLSNVLVLASYSMQLLEEWRTHGIWLEFGHVKVMGSISEVVAGYNRATSAAA